MAAERLAALCRRHGLTPVGRIATTIAPAVARVRASDGSPCILKVCPDEADAARELLALEAWAATGLVPGARRLEPDVLLLDDLGGATLDELGDDAGAEHAEAVGALVRRLRLRAPPGARPVGDLIAETDVYNEEFGLEDEVLRLARDASRALRALPPEPWLVHGDLQPNNVLLAGAELRPIDPGGLRGSQAFDLAQYAVHVSGDQPAALERLVAGYGRRPADLHAWFAYLAVNLYRVAQIPRLDAGWRLAHVRTLVQRLAAS